MKKSIILLSVFIFLATVLSFAADQTKPELRPSQKIMQARLAWMSGMNKNLGTNNFDLVAKDANELAGQTQKVGEGLANPLAKELTLAISALAKEVSKAAEAKNAAAAKAKIGEVKGKCDECHAKIRDKK
jgi:cytochrome c556